MSAFLKMCVSVTGYAEAELQTGNFISFPQWLTLAFLDNVPHLAEKKGYNQVVAQVLCTQKSQV